MNLAVGLVLAAASVHAQQWSAPVTVSKEGDIASLTAVTALSDQWVVVAYTDHASKGGKAVLCKRMDDTLQRISEVPFDSDGKISGASTLAMERLSDDRFVLCYQDTTPLGKALIGKVADGKIQWLSESVFTGANKGEFYDVAALSPEKLVFIYHGATNKRGFVVVAELMEDTLIFGPAVEINPAGPGIQYLNQFNGILALDENRFVAAWADAKLGGQGFARVGQVNGNTITLGPAAQYSAANAPYATMVAMGPDRFALAYRDGAQGSKPAVKVGALSGNAITFGASEAVPADGVADCIAVTPISKSIFGIAYRNNDAGRQSALHFCRVSGDQVEVTPKYAVDRGASFQQLEKLDERTLLLTHVIPGNKVECLLFQMK
jgi:hypothetical protein